MRLLSLGARRGSAVGGRRFQADAFGSALIEGGLDGATLKEWILDPVVAYGGGDKGSLFDALEDSDAAACAAKIAELKALA